MRFQYKEVKRMVDIKSLEIYKSISDYVRRVNKNYFLQKAYLFGSFAYGNFNEDSDIDIALVSSSFSGNRFTDNVNVGILTWGINTRIEPVTFRPEDFNTDNMLAAEIISSGIEIPIEN